MGWLVGENLFHRHDVNALTIKHTLFIEGADLPVTELAVEALTTNSSLPSQSQWASLESPPPKPWPPWSAR